MQRGNLGGCGGYRIYNGNRGQYRSEYYHARSNNVPPPPYNRISPPRQYYNNEYQDFPMYQQGNFMNDRRGDFQQGNFMADYRDDFQQGNFIPMNQNQDFHEGGNYPSGDFSMDQREGNLPIMNKYGEYFGPATQGHNYGHYNGNFSINDFYNENFTNNRNLNYNNGNRGNFSNGGNFAPTNQWQRASPPRRKSLRYPASPPLESYKRGGRGTKSRGHARAPQVQQQRGLRPAGEGSPQGAVGRNNATHKNHDFSHFAHVSLSVSDAACV